MFRNKARRAKERFFTHIDTKSDSASVQTIVVNQTDYLGVLFELQLMFEKININNFFFSKK